MPEFTNPAQRGESFWQTYENPDTTSIMNFWDDQFNTYISDEMHDMGFNPYMSMFTHGTWWGPGEDQWAVDPGEMWRAEESGNISRGLQEDKYRKLIPAQERRYGVGGFASSGIRPRVNLIDQYVQDLDSVRQETEAAQYDVLSSYGLQAEETLGSIMSAGGFSTMFGTSGEEDVGLGEMYDQLGDEWSGWQSAWTGGGNFAEQLENCVEQQLDQMTLTGPNDVFIAVQACKDLV